MEKTIIYDELLEVYNNEIYYWSLLGKSKLKYKILFWCLAACPMVGILFLLYQFNFQIYFFVIVCLGLFGYFNVWYKRKIFHTYRAKYQPKIDKSPKSKKIITLQIILLKERLGGANINKDYIKTMIDISKIQMEQTKRIFNFSEIPLISFFVGVTLLLVSKYLDANHEFFKIINEKLVFYISVYIAVIMFIIWALNKLKFFINVYLNYPEYYKHKELNYLLINMLTSIP